MTLVNTVGAPVRDKLMADGVILAWGIETPVLRYPGGTTHLIWFSVANWEGVEKVLNGMEAQLAKLAADEAQAAEAARAKKQKPAMTTAERTREVFDMSKTRDWLTRDIVSGYGPPPAAGVLPVTRYNFVKVKPGKGLIIAGTGNSTQAYFDKRSRRFVSAWLALRVNMTGFHHFTGCHCKLSAAYKATAYCRRSSLFIESVPLSTTFLSLYNRTSQFLVTRPGFSPAVGGVGISSQVDVTPRCFAISGRPSLRAGRRGAVRK